MGSLINITIQGNFDELHRDIKKILSINKLILEDMAKSKEEFSGLATEIRTALQNLSADITRLTDSLQNGGLTEAQEEEVYNEFRTLADEIKTLADRTPEPPVEPQP